MTHLPRSETKPKPEPIVHWQFEAIGTLWTIDLYQSVKQPETLRRVIMRRIATFDKHYSRFRSDSLIATMAHKAGTYRLPADAKPLLDLYQDLYQLSDGLVTPLIGQVLVDAGYDAEYSLSPGIVRWPLSWEAVLNYDYPNLTLKQPVLLDFGAAGKGHLVDIVSAIIEKAGIKAYCVDAGGDMHINVPQAGALSIGLEHPADPLQMIGVAKLNKGSLCGSAGNRRAWAGWHHIIDPKYLKSPRHILAVWVVADSTLLADGLTTALFFVEPKRLSARYTFEYALVRADYSLEHSRNFPAEFFSKSTGA